MTWYEFLFQTGDHHFEWVGVSAVLAGIGLIINAFWNRKKFKADLLSKSRLEQMNIVRKLLGKFLAESMNVESQVYDLVFLLERNELQKRGKLSNENPLGLENIAASRQSVNEHMDKFNSTYNELLLNIINNDKSESFVNAVSNTTKFVGSRITYFLDDGGIHDEDGRQTSQNELDNRLVELRNAAVDYLDVEMNKVRKGI